MSSIMPSEEERKASFRELEILRALILERKTTAAAHALGISQPAISRAIAKLEAKVGRTLFERAGGRLTPTADALALNQEIEPIFETLARINNMHWGDRGVSVLRVACPPTLAHRFLHVLLAGFIKEHPGTEVVLDICATPEIVAAVAQQRSHLGITDSAVFHPAVELKPFRRAPVVCLVPAGHPLEEKEEIGPRDLDGQDFIRLSSTHSLGATVDAIFRAHQVRVRAVVETVTSVSAVEMVRHGIGCTIINPFPITLSRDLERINVRRFVPVTMQQTSFVTAVNTPLSPVAGAFIAYLRAHQPTDAHSQIL